MALPHGSQPLLDRFHRRRLLKASGAITALAFLGAWTISRTTYDYASTKAQRERLTLDDILALMKKGTKRFYTGKREDRNSLTQQRARARA
jgi:carbonic anhydrase